MEKSSLWGIEKLLNKKEQHMIIFRILGFFSLSIFCYSPLIWIYIASTNFTSGSIKNGPDPQSWLSILQALLAELKQLNEDPQVHGIIVQVREAAKKVIFFSGRTTKRGIGVDH